MNSKVELIFQKVILVWENENKLRQGFFLFRVKEI
jgi:hypothetical protein